ncbi:MAG: hypothetical protein UW45_C0015G0004 [Parcubacteria group bacterium GW2011_GWC2_44_22]|nr:MAG: hypothetical protein UW45_C0015G0004 [Parcubacteria group bacterium GW2011_GWC2_44_22]
MGGPPPEETSKWDGYKTPERHSEYGQKPENVEHKLIRRHTKGHRPYVETEMPKTEIEQSEVNAMEPAKETDMPETEIEKLGFNAVYQLGKGDTYQGNADIVLLVWHKGKITAADQYREAHYAGKVVDIAVCEDPNVQKEQLGDKAFLYN